MAPGADRVRGANLDAFAISAPLTAAFVGVVVAQGMAGAIGQTTGSGDAGIAPARGSGAGGELTLRGGEAGSVAVPGGEAAVLSGTGGQAGIAGEGSDGDSEPVEDAEASGPSGPEGPVLPQETSSVTASEATIIAGPQVSLSFGGAGTLIGTAAGDDDGTAGSGGGSGGTIGDHVGGTDGDDVIHGTDNNDHLSGGAGDDVIHGHGGDDVLDGGTGNDQLFGGAGNDHLLGREGHDQLHGGAGDDLLDGGTGNDLLSGDAGRDVLLGGAGNDTLDGGVGADRMIGGAGNDQLIVDNLHDVALENGRGPDGGGGDTLRIDDGFATTLNGAFGTGEATFVLSGSLGQGLPEGAAGHSQQVGSEIENVVLTGSAGHDVIGDGRDNRMEGNDGDNELHGRAGDDVLIGGAGDDHLEGGMGRDVLQGGTGNDVLAGGMAADQLLGGDGDDVLEGGLGADQLYGQAGNDTFLLGLNDSAVDSIFDHEGANQLNLQGIDGNVVQTGVAGNDLYLVVDYNPVAVIKDYLGNQGSLLGVDSGQGIVSIDGLMAENAGSGPALSSPTDLGASPTVPDDDLLGSWLTRPSLTGGSGSQSLRGTSEADWLSGLDGDDHLQGRAGRDVIEGGAGSDLLEGGASDDRYLFRSGEAGLDTIRDAEGSNVAELHGFTGARLEGVVVGSDLWVVADYAPLFKVESFVGNEEAFAGIQNGDSFIPTEQLFG